MKKLIYVLLPWGNEVALVPPSELVSYERAGMYYRRHYTSFPFTEAFSADEARIDLMFQRALKETLADIKRMFRSAPYPWHEREDRARRPWRYR